MQHDRARPLRIALLPEWIGNTLSPCASIRLHAYLSHLARAQLLEFRALLVPEVKHYQPDIVVWHRGSVSDSDDLDALLALREGSGTRLIYDIDDNLLDMEEHGERGAYAHLQAAVRHSLAVADEVWCSTPALSARVRRESAAETLTLANVLDPSLWLMRPPRPARSNPGPFQLLYMGTRTHDADFEILAGAMDLIESRAPGSVQLTVIGVRAHDRQDQPWLHVRSVPDFVGASYPGFVHWLNGQGGFDAGVAPLVSSEFNACKSHIKVLDYAAMGLPAIASRIPAYEHALQDGLNCILSGNSPESWASAIVGLAADRQRHQTIATHAAALVDPSRFELAAQARLERLGTTLKARRQSAPLVANGASLLS